MHTKNQSCTVYQNTKFKRTSEHNIGHDLEETSPFSVLQEKFLRRNSKIKAELENRVP